MTIFRAPQHLFDEMRDEKKRRKARAKVIRWMTQLKPLYVPGDVIVAPNPRDGREEAFRFSPDEMRKQ